MAGTACSVRTPGGSQPWACWLIGALLAVLAVPGWAPPALAEPIWADEVGSELDTAALEALVDRDLERERYRFYALPGTPSRIPAVGGLGYRRCFADVAELVELDPKGELPGATGLSQQSDRHAFARAYNERMRSRLLERGLASCLPQVDWDGALRAMARSLRDGFERGSGASVAAAADPSRSGYDFAVRVPELSRSAATAARLCAILVEHGLPGPVRLRFTRARVHPPHSPAVDHGCERGELSGSPSTPAARRRGP
jgi:hypothetical protein